MDTTEAHVHALQILLAWGRLGDQVQAFDGGHCGELLFWDALQIAPT